MGLIWTVSDSLLNLSGLCPLRLGLIQTLFEVGHILSQSLNDPEKPTQGWSRRLSEAGSTVSTALWELMSIRPQVGVMQLGDGAVSLQASVHVLGGSDCLGGSFEQAMQRTLFEGGWVRTSKEGSQVNWIELYLPGIELCRTMMRIAIIEAIHQCRLGQLCWPAWSPW